jgi:hypothetical protein
VTAGFIVHQGVTVADEESCWWRMERDGDPCDMHSTYSTPTIRIRVRLSHSTARRSCAKQENTNDNYECGSAKLKVDFYGGPIARQMNSEALRLTTVLCTYFTSQCRECLDRPVSMEINTCRS